MKIYLDTNILYYKFSGKPVNIDLKGKSLTSINALEFLKNIEKEHHNKAKYHIPLLLYQSHMFGFSSMQRLMMKDKRLFNKRLSDAIIFDFKQNFESYTLYNNKSIAQVINNNCKDIFLASIKSIEKSSYKDIKNRFNFILKNNLICDSITSTDVELGYELLDNFLKRYTLKPDFRNCWNDILILAKSINEGAKLITTDKLLNTFASEVYDGRVNRKGDFIEIDFPRKYKREDELWYKKESKGYINRGWFYKMNNQ